MLVLTNAMRPMQRPRVQAALLELNRSFPGRIAVRVSLDHYAAERTRRCAVPVHGSRFCAACTGSPATASTWLSPAAPSGVKSNSEMRVGYAALFAHLGLAIDAADPRRLVLFPEMDPARDVPEITERCWGILVQAAGADDVRHVAHGGAAQGREPGQAVVACTLLA